MALRTVQWSSFSKLPCAGCTPADIFICTTLNIDNAVLSGRLIGSQQFTSGGRAVFRYTLQYDDVVLPAGVVITCADVSGVFCRGCVSDWVTQEVNNAIAQIPPPTVVFNDLTYVDEHDFLAAPDTPIELDLIFSNASLLLPMQVLLTWGWSQRLSTTLAFDLTTITGNVEIDGSMIPIFNNQTLGFIIPGGPVTVSTGGTNGAFNTILGPGQIRTATLILAPTHGAALPDSEWFARNIFIAGFGVTQ